MTDDRARSPSIALLVVGAFLGPVRLALVLGLVAVGASGCYRFRAGPSGAEAGDRRG